jgi:hypothetical protein
MRNQEVTVRIALAFTLSVSIVLSDACAVHARSPSTPTHIQNLQGCFRVSYRFIEDGKHDYEVKDVLEWITLKEQSGAYVIQHYGLYGDQIIEHFNETWSPLGDGRWRQDVGPARYSCSSEVRMGQLQCSARAAPKPVRDRNREDYAVLNRVSAIQITPKGWVQNETNEKVSSTGQVVATEVGWVEYRRIDDESVCGNAKRLHPSE